jgi:hypothetical protein
MQLQVIVLGSSPFNIIYFWNVLLLPAVRTYSTNVPSTDEHTPSLMKVQQEVHKALELTRAHQTRVSQDWLKLAAPLVSGQDTVIVRTAPYLKTLGKKAKITLPWIEPILVLEGPNNNNDNYKIVFSPMMTSVHPWVARFQFKLYLFPNGSMYLSEHFTRSGPIVVKGEKVWVVEKIVDDKKKN